MPLPRSAVGVVCALLLGACSDASFPTSADPPDARNAAAAAPLAAVAGTGASGTTVTLKNVDGSNLCAGLHAGTTDAGTNVVTKRCAGTAVAQRFTWAGPTSTPGPVTAAGGACLEVAGTSTKDGAPVGIGTCRNTPRQQWATTAAGTVVGLNGKCLSVRQKSTNVGWQIVVRQCDGGADQRWIARPVATGDTPTPTPTPTPDTAGNWTYCVAAGAPCEFLGLRTVRLGAAAGPYVEQVAMAHVPCAVYGFGDRNPAPGKALHCDYGPLLTSTLTNPMPGMGPLAGATVVVPQGGPGAAGPQARATGDVLTPSGSGSFRTTCTLATYAFNDPIVFPGRPGASHLHAFFGNVAVNASSTPGQLVASGNSTCRGGTLNRSAYWVPALVDTKTGAVLPPADAVIYYKTGYGVKPSTVQAFPAGLRMVAGDMRATGAQPHAGWGCRDRYVVSATVPTVCPAGDAVRLTVQFPQCWDGVNLDAPDHKSHMAYPVYRNPPEVSTCPATHPVMLPEITEHFDYPVVAASEPAGWRLASDMYAASTRGGLSAHADWMNGWDPATMRTIVTQCLNRSLDCGVGLIGNGQTLY